MDIKQKIQKLKSNGKIISTRLNLKSKIFGPIAQEILDLTNHIPNINWSERIYLIENNLSEPPKCVVCKVNYQSWAKDRHEYNISKTCSKVCSAKSESKSEKRLNTMVEKYGSKISQKSRMRLQERHSEFIRKGKITLKEKYGVDNASQIAGRLDRIKESNLKKYGHESYWKSEIGVQRTLDNAANKFKKMLISLPHIVDISASKPKYEWQVVKRISFKCTKCNYVDDIADGTVKFRLREFGDICSKCLGIKHGSKIQKDLCDFIRENYNGKIFENYILPNRTEIDIYIPDLNLGFELNGNFWHSYNRLESKEEKLRHYTKYKTAKENNIKLIQILEGEWINENPLVKQKIKYYVGQSNKIYARKCQIKILTGKEMRSFYDANHIQGHLNSTIHLGLIHNDQIVMGLSLSKPRFSDQYEYEITRMASNSNVVGGASKLFNYFVKTFSPKSIICYSDLRWGSGNVYNKIGMNYIGDTSPGYYYLDPKDIYSLMSRNKFQKHKLKNLLKVFDSNLSESENMFMNGYRRLWDCGNAKFVWRSI